MMSGGKNVEVTRHPGNGKAGFLFGVAARDSQYQFLKYHY